LKGTSAGVEQQSQAAAQRAKHEQQHLHEQNARLTAELAAVTEDRYELQVNFAAGVSACKPYHTLCLLVTPREREKSVLDMMVRTQTCCDTMPHTTRHFCQQL